MSQLRDLQLMFQEAARKGRNDLPLIHEEKTKISLHFNLHAVQSVMSKADPEHLVLGYTQSMMGFLFFKPAPESIGMIGLGGGSLAKYCISKLPDAHFTAVEVNADVISLRGQFKIPPDNHKFRVLHSNGADYVANKADKVDVLLVDGFDAYGHPAKLCSAGFYDNCYSKLRDGGVMVVNLLSSDLKFGTYTNRIRDSFDGKVVVIDAEESGNKIAFAYKGDHFPLRKESLLETISTIGSRHPIALDGIAHKIMQRSNIHSPSQF